MFMAIKNSFFRLEYVIEYKSEKRMNRVADFFRTEQTKLVSYVRSRIDDTADREAEDIVQDVMLNIFDKADISIPIENLAAYIYQSLRNRIVDLFRKRKEVDSLEKAVQDSGHDPEEIFENKQLQDMVFEALDFLNEDERDLLMATEFDGRSFRELSEEWGVPLGTLLARKSRALKKMRKKITNMV